MYYRNSEHKNKFATSLKSLHKPIYQMNAEFLAALFLLSSDNRLWNRVKSNYAMNRVDFNKINLRGINPDCYTLCKAAQDLYEDTCHVDFTDLGCSDLINNKLNSLLKSAIQIKRDGSCALRLNTKGDIDLSTDLSTNTVSIFKTLVFTETRLCFTVMMRSAIIVLALNVFSFLTLKQDLDYFAKEMIDVTTTYGKTSGEANTRYTELCSETGLNPSYSFTGTEYFNATNGKVQLGDTICITITYNTYVHGLGVFKIPITLTAKHSGLSQKYWK